MTVHVLSLSLSLSLLEHWYSKTPPVFFHRTAHRPAGDPRVPSCCGSDLRGLSVLITARAGASRRIAQGLRVCACSQCEGMPSAHRSDAHARSMGPAPAPHPSAATLGPCEPSTAICRGARPRGLGVRRGVACVALHVSSRQERVPSSGWATPCLSTLFSMGLWVAPNAVRLTLNLVPHRALWPGWSWERAWLPFGPSCRLFRGAQSASCWLCGEGAASGSPRQWWEVPTVLLARPQVGVAARGPRLAGQRAAGHQPAPRPQLCDCEVVAGASSP